MTAEYAAAQLDTVHRQLPNAATAAVARAAIFQTVEPTAVAALMTHLQSRLYARRHQIYTEGEAGDTLYIVTSGKVKLGKRSPDGRSHLLAVVGPSEMFGELSIFDPGPRTATATALTDVAAVTVERDVFRAWVADRPEIAERLLRVLARRLRRTDNDLSDLIFTDVGARVAKHLLRLAQRFAVQEDGAMRLTHNMTQEEIAQLIGTSRESINKALADFTHQGWIRVHGHSILITDSQALVRCAHAGSPGPDSPAHTNGDGGRAEAEAAPR